MNQKIMFCAKWSVYASTVTYIPVCLCVCVCVCVCGVLNIMFVFITFQCSDTYWVESFSHQLLTYLPKHVHFGTTTFLYAHEFGSV